jgi:hypothetical protein
MAGLTNQIEDHFSMKMLKYYGAMLYLNINHVFFVEIITV